MTVTEDVTPYSVEFLVLMTVTEDVTSYSVVEF